MPVTRRPQPPAPGPRGTEGFTLVEVAVTAVIMMIVLGALFGVLDSGTKAEGRTQALIQSQEDVRFAMAEILRDVRAADPVLPLGSVPSYASTVELRHGDAATPVFLRWRLDPLTSTIVRETLSGPGGSPTATTYRLERVRNGDAGALVTLFRYYNSAGTELTTANATAADLANCTIRVRVTVKADTDPAPGLQPFSLTSDAELRNLLPGGIGC